jgi:hypothetical protein
MWNLVKIKTMVQQQLLPFPCSEIQCEHCKIRRFEFELRQHFF